MSDKVFAFGHLPDPPDSRDFKLKTPTLSALPVSVDLSSKLQPVKNQGRLGSCTAFATTAMVEFVRNKQELLQWDASPLFTYYSTRKIENTIDSDSGAYVRDALKSVVSDGVAKETTWPYIVENFTIQPPASAWTEALDHQALVYYRVNQTRDDVLGCLADGYPFTFGIKLYDSFINTQTGFMVNNIVPIPNLSTDKFVGGHCMLATGYLSSQDGTVQITARNSWGVYVGLEGYHNIPLEYILDRAQSMDFWTIRSEERVDEDPTPPKPIVIPPDPVTPIVIVPPDPIVPEPFTPPENIWKQPRTYILIGFVILSLLFLLIR